MFKYICPRCHYSTQRKSNMRTHIIRKNICIGVHKDVPIKTIADSYGIDIRSTENNLEHTISNIKHKQSHTFQQTITHTACKYCNKQFNTSNSCYRHQKHYCKYKKKEITITQDELNKIKEEADKKARKQLEEEKKKIDVIADKRAQKLVLELADKLVPNKTMTNSNNNTQNIQNNNTLINNNHQLKINNFGEEKTHYITDEQLKIMFVDPRNTVIQHIKNTHYHALHPENFNAKITNYNSKHMKVYKEGWITVNKRATICKMYNDHEKIINIAFERLKSQLPEKVIENYNEYKASVYRNYHTYNQRLLDTEAVIITGTQQNKMIDILCEEEVLRLAKEQNKTPCEIFAEHMPDIFAEREEKWLESLKQK